MATIPTPATFATGERVTALKLNQNIRDGLVYAQTPPSCSMSTTTTQSIPNASTTNLVFDSEEWDTDNMADIAADLITVQTAGIYNLTGYVTFPPGATGTRRMCAMYKNGIDLGVHQEVPSEASCYAALHISVMVRLAVGDTLNFRAYQNSGAAVSTYVASPTVTRFQALWLSK